MQLKPGAALDSTVDDVSVIVTRAPAQDIELCCGGRPMVAKGTVDIGAPVDPGHAAGTLLGKRYVDETGTLEVLCTKAGVGSLSVGGAPLSVAQAKALPSSD